MEEESEKTNGKKKLPSIPSNYVTLLQLQERWNKEKERKEKQEPQQQKQEEKLKETNVEDSVTGRGSRNNRKFNRDNGKRVAEGKPRDDKTAAEDLDNEKKGEELKKKKKNDRWKKFKEKKRNEMEEKARAANEGGNTGNAPLPASTERDKGEEQLIRYEVHAPNLASGKEKDVESRKEWKPRLNTRTYGRKTETGRKFQTTKRSKGEVELIGDEVHAPEVASVEEENVEAIRESRPRLATRNLGRKAEIGRKFQATESSKGEKELIGDEVHAPMPPSVEEENVEAIRELRPRLATRNHGRKAEIGRKSQATESSKGEKELIRDNVHAPMPASVKEENVEAIRESRPRLATRNHGRKAEIGRKFQATESSKGEKELIRDEVHAPMPASVKEENVEAIRESRPRLATRNHGRKTEIGRKFQATESSKGEKELIRDEVHAPMPASVKEENVEAIRELRPRLATRNHGHKAEIGRKFQATESSKGEEELIGDEVHAPMSASVKEENVEVRRESESQPMFNRRTHERTAEIGLRFELMSVNGWMRKGDNRRYGRQHFNINQRRGGNRDRINEGMVWVKKVEVED